MVVLPLPEPPTNAVTLNAGTSRLAALTIAFCATVTVKFSTTSKFELTYYSPPRGHRSPEGEEPLSMGSRQSRKASPIILKQTTVKKIKNAGQRIHGANLIRTMLMASLNILPQLAYGS